MEVATPTAPRSISTWRFDDGALEALKLLGLVLMLVDHVNAIVLAFGVPIMFDLGRLVFPLFAFVFAFNLARPSTTNETILRIVRRLLIYGALSMPAYIYVHGWWPCNVLLTFALAAFLVFCLRRQSVWYTALGMSSFIIGGAFVEFWWFGLCFTLACWWWCRRPSVLAALSVISTCATLSLVNGNQWALFALLLILAISRMPLKTPRWPRLFYWFYPAHLTALVLLTWGTHGRIH